MLWFFVFSPFQQQRIITFVNPDADLRGSGYNSAQATIAVGSGGVWGKGVGNGSQSRLQFLPQYQTDFVIAAFAEEWGFVGGILLLVLLIRILAYGYVIALNSRHKFGFLLAMGLMINFSLYIFINIGMVMGLLPVVGAPLPLVSYGGTSMMAIMISFGLMMSVWVHRNRAMPKADMD